VLTLCAAAILITFVHTTGAAQAAYPPPVSTFDIDTALVASPVFYSLSVRRPAITQVVFPDTLYDYTPFELRKRTGFATRKVGDSLWVDSAVYELISFSGAEALPLALPVFYLLPSGDSLPVYAPTVVLYQRLLKDVGTESDTLQAAIQTLAVPERFNYPYWIIGLALVAGILASANAFFGKPLERYFSLWIESQRHRAFIRSYDKLVAQVQQRGADGPLERALNVWKGYIERVEAVPYTTYTTKDFAERFPDPTLTKSLQTLDKYIYGGFPPEQAAAAYAALRRMAIRIYAQKAQSLRHG
jgi:hypothetical protein